MEPINVIIAFSVVFFSGVVGAICDIKGLLMPPALWWSWGAITGILAVSIGLS